MWATVVMNMQVHFGLKHKDPQVGRAADISVQVAMTAGGTQLTDDGAHVPADAAPVMPGEKPPRLAAPSGLKRMYVVQLPDFSTCESGNSSSASSKAECGDEDIVLELQGYAQPAPARMCRDSVSSCYAMH